jgi:hypothetical protein
MVVAVTFGESLALLVVTAALTGVLAPIVVQITNRRRLDEQRLFEEDLKRETAFFDAQVQFLNELATAIWGYLEKALAVSYAANYSPPDRFKQVWKAYDDESFARLGQIASQVSMARTLFSSPTANRLDDFYSNWLEGHFDFQLSRMARNPGTKPAEWADWHDEMHQESQRRAADLLRIVAEEAGLTYEQRRQQPESSSWFSSVRSGFGFPKRR